MPESKPFHEQHAKKEHYSFKVSAFAIWTALCKQWDLLLPWVNQMFQKKNPKPSHTEDSYSREEILPPHWLVNPCIAGGMVCFSPFYFFWLICTFQAETHKSVSHSHVLTAKSLNARLYLLLRLSPLSYRNYPCFIKMLDMIDCSFLGFFYLPAKVHGHCWVEHSTILSSQAANRERKELGYEDASVPPDKACSHPTSEHRLKWARFWLWLAQKG